MPDHVSNRIRNLCPIPARSERQRCGLLRAFAIGVAAYCVGCSDLEVRTVLAHLGHAEAQVLLAGMYLEGIDGEADPEAAEHWLLRAANQGYVRAQLELGVLYRQQPGDQPEYEEGIVWLRKAAESGNRRAQNDLAVALFEEYREAADSGRSPDSEDRREWLSWLRAAAQGGHARAQSNLGAIYLDGRYVAPNRKRALLWLRRSADQGDRSAIEALDRLATHRSGADPQRPPTNPIE